MLISCIEAETLTQDSICCVNTALIILIFSERDNSFQTLLEGVKKATFTSKTKVSKPVLKNFR